MTRKAKTKARKKAPAKKKVAKKKTARKASKKKSSKKKPPGDTPEQRRPDGMPQGNEWKKGQSGNPSGLSKARRAVVDGVRAKLGEDANWKLACRTLIKLLKHKDGKVQIAAVREYFDRVVGKAPLAITGADGDPLIPDRPIPEKADLTPKELDELRRILGSTGAA